MKPNLKITAAAAAVTCAIGAGLYVAVPASATSPRTPSASPSEHGRPGDHAKRHPRRAMRGVHGEATVRRDGGFGQVSWQRGEITAISGGNLTVRSADGASWQWATAKNTRVRKNKAKSSVSALAVKDQVVVFGPLSGTTRTARAVIVPKRK